MTRGPGRVFDRPRGSGRNWSIAYFYRGVEQRESVARYLGRAPALVTRQDAERCLKARLKQMGQGRFLGVHEDRLTVAQAIDAWYAHLGIAGKKSLKEYRSHIKPPKAALGHLRAAELTGTEVEAWLARQLEAGYARGTLANWVAILKAALRLAHKRRELAVVPWLPTVRVQNARQGFFEPDDVARLLSTLTPPVDDIIRFCYLTGWRIGEILPLTWAQVDRTARTLRILDSKSGEGRALPLEGDLWGLMERRWKARRVGTLLSEWVFHRQGRPVRSFRKSWVTARTAAGMPGALVHDFRRTASRDLVEKAGMDYKTASTVTGHKTLGHFTRYQIVDMRRTALALQALQAARHPDTSTDTGVRRLKKR